MKKIKISGNNIMKNKVLNRGMHKRNSRSFQGTSNPPNATWEGLID